MKPNTLRVMEALNGRSTFNDEQFRYLRNMQGGYNGECEFVAVMEDLKCPHILLRDLYFEPKFSGPIQIDFLLLIGNTAVIYEVKNYSGVWQYSEEAYRQKEFERANPLIQLARTKQNFKALLRELGYTHVTVDAVVFHVGTTFTLLGAPENRNVILPTQIQEHVTKLNQYQYDVSQSLVDLSGQLELAVRVAPPFTKMIPEYSFGSLKKGLKCEACAGFVERFSQRICLCPSCGHKTNRADAVEAAITDYEFLFPDRKLSGSVLAEWCGGLISQSHIRSVIRMRNDGSNRK
ncbi:nuclease-related domain-containing protein [Jeotgalibaca porci]|uniref:nuclease-related domain-containing protein n=1 Tax=Jeotgalibaca porci TaxID=1868793 RepID=UPI00359FF522